MTHDTERDMWANGWLHNEYGLDDDDELNAGQVEELLRQALYDYEKKMGQEVVICSAVRASDGYVIRGHRHHDCIRTMRGIPRYYDEKYSGEDSHGFVTSRGRFVTRKEGYDIQKAAGIRSALEGTEHADGAYLHGELYSEDLY